MQPRWTRFITELVDMTVWTLKPDEHGVSPQEKWWAYAGPSQLTGHGCRDVLNEKQFAANDRSTRTLASSLPSRHPSACSP